MISMEVVDPIDSRLIVTMAKKDNVIGIHHSHQ